MKEPIGHVMSARIRPIEIVVKDVGKPRHWMPVTFVHRSESPEDTLEGQSLADVRIICNIHIITEVNEFVILCLPKGRKGLPR